MDGWMFGADCLIVRCGLGGGVFDIQKKNKEANKEAITLTNKQPNQETNKIGKTAGAYFGAPNQTRHIHSAAR